MSKRTYGNPRYPLNPLVFSNSSTLRFPKTPYALSVEILGCGIRISLMTTSFERCVEKTPFGWVAIRILAGSSLSCDARGAMVSL